MVRFKNRHLLVEFLQPASLAPSFAAAFEPRSAPPAESDSDDDEDELFPIQALPFLLPLPGEDLSQPKLKLGDEGGGVIYRSVRGIVQDVFGDEGWGRISSSFKGE
jgi:ribonuclease P/MRP protein subunit POP5